MHAAISCAVPPLQSGEGGRGVRSPLPFMHHPSFISVAVNCQLSTVHYQLPFIMLLTHEESTLWNLARTWRSPGAPPAGLDWARVVQMARTNRMQTLLHGALTRTGALDALPGEPRALL